MISARISTANDADAAMRYSGVGGRRLTDNPPKNDDCKRLVVAI
jgi:hypothetical protein